MTVAQAKADRLIERMEKNAALLKRRVKQLRGLKLKVDAAYDQAINDMDDANRSLDDHRHVVESLNRELIILKETAIPVLTAANELALQRYDADTAVQVRRQVAMDPRITKEE